MEKNTEAIKEKISWYKHLFTFSSAIEATCIGWLVTNYKSAGIILLVLNAIAITGFLVGAGVTGYKVRKYIKELE